MHAYLANLRVRAQAGMYNHLLPREAAKLAAAWVGDRRGRRAYRLLGTDELLATRRTDTAFVFGSGRSLLDIGPDEWEAIAECSTISLREFPRQQWVRADYHLTAEVDFLDEYAQRLRENPRYADTVFVVAGGLRALRGNELIGRRLLRPGARVYRFRRVARGRYAPPSRTPKRLVHGANSIFDATNLAYALGFSRIVLAGADYYNKEYFWLDAAESRSYDDPRFPATQQWPYADGIVEMMGRWHRLLAAEGVQLCVYDPRSLLARELPVFRFC